MTHSSLLMNLMSKKSSGNLEQQLCGCCFTGLLPCVSALRARHVHAGRCMWVDSCALWVSDEMCCPSG